MAREFPMIQVTLRNGDTKVYEDCDYFTGDPKDGCPPGDGVLLMSKNDMTVRILWGVAAVEVLKPSSDEEDADESPATG